MESSAALAVGDGPVEELTDDEDGNAAECKHSMDIMYDTRMSVTIAETIGRMLQQQANKLQDQEGRETPSSRQSPERLPRRPSGGLKRDKCPDDAEQSSQSAHSVRFK